MYGSAVIEETPTLSFFDRIWFAWVCFFRVIFDPAFARRAYGVRQRAPELPPSEPPRALEAKREPEQEPAPAKKPAKKPEAKAPSVPPPPEEGPALQLLGLLQREGRLIDFLQQDITDFPDAEIGAAVRVVHEGCRKALGDHAEIVPVRSEEEGTRVNIEAGFDPHEVKLTGDVRGSGPFKGVLRHRGWRAKKLTLPVPIDGHDAHVLAPAEVEL